MPNAEKKHPRLVKVGDYVQLDDGRVEMVWRVSTVLHLANGLDVVKEDNEEVVVVEPEPIPATDEQIKQAVSESQTAEQEATSGNEGS